MSTRPTYRESSIAPANHASTVALSQAGSAGASRIGKSGVGATPVTMLVTRHIAPDQVEGFSVWMREGGLLAAGFPGFLGSGMLHPPQGEDKYQFVLRFDSEASMDRWEKSLPRRMWLERGAKRVSRSTVARVSGMDSWFGLKPMAPPRWKQAISIWLVYFPMLLLFSTLLQDQLMQLPLFWRVLLTTATMSPVLSYLLIPFITRVLRGWLYRT